MKVFNIPKLSLSSILHHHSRSGIVEITSVKNTDQKSGADSRIHIKAEKQEKSHTIIVKGEIVPPAPNTPPPLPEAGSGCNGHIMPSGTPLSVLTKPSTPDNVTYNPLYTG